jgi:tripartite-type tricarboxylate transporter receptor subunit TctC
MPEQTPYDPVEDFTPVALIGGGPMVLVVPAASPFRDVRSLLEAVRARPGQMTWATSGAGGIGHLTGEYLKLRAGGLRAEHVPYRGGSAVMEALAKGEVDYSLEVLASVASHLRDGLSRGAGGELAGAASALPRHPDARRERAAGLRDHDLERAGGAARLPEPIVARLAAAAGAVLADPAAAARLAAAGVDPAGPGTPAATRAFLVAERAKFAGIVERAGLRLGR